MSSRCCIHEGCTTSASCHYSNETEGLYCSKHKKENMICVITKKCCHENCLISAYWGCGIKDLY